MWKVTDDNSADATSAHEFYKANLCNDISKYFFAAEIFIG